MSSRILAVQLAQGIRRTLGRIEGLARIEGEAPHLVGMRLSTW